jgi:exodeoxyribonuclease VII large subunit
VLNLARLSNRLKITSPQNRVQSERQRIDELSLRLYVQLNHLVRLQFIQLTGLSKQLEALNPDSVLKRGYAIVTNKEGEIITSIRQVKLEDWLNVYVTDGKILVKVSNTPLAENKP